MWTTETSHLTGAYCSADYGCSRKPGYPVAIEQNKYIHVGQGGDAGGPEYSLMAMDYLLWSSADPTAPTQSAKDYLRIATQNAEYFMHHFKNKSAGAPKAWMDKNSAMLQTFAKSMHRAAGDLIVPPPVSAHSAAAVQALPEVNGKHVEHQRPGLRMDVARDPRPALHNARKNRVNGVVSRAEDAAPLTLPRGRRRR